MENFTGIISLLIACIEIVLLINLFIFSQKNKVNKLIISTVTLLFGYQFMEFFMCYTQNYSSILVYFSFIIISFLPPLLLYLVLTLNKVESSLAKIVFLPILILLGYYLFVIDGFEITSCTVLFASYEMPFGDLYGIIYYSPIIASVYLLIKMVKNPNNKTEKVNFIIMLGGILFAFVPVAIVIALFPFLLDYVESFFCKAASLIAITLTIFAMRNNNNPEMIVNE